MGKVKKGSKPWVDQTVILYDNPMYDAKKPQISLQYETKSDAEGNFVFERVVPREMWMSRQWFLPKTERNSAYASSPPEKIVVKAGETLKVQVGGTGRPVIGKVILTNDQASQKWSLRGSLQSRVPWAVFPEGYDEWTQAHPSSSVAWTVRGAHGIKWGWEARGGGKAESVQDQSWQLFWQRLEQAEQDLRKAAELDPADPVPWTYLVISARGLERGVPEIGERLKQAHARRPWHHFAFSQALQGFAKKWGGTHELMFDLARQVQSGAPDGASAHTVVAEAHVERWLYMASWDKDEASALSYFRTQPVPDEIRQAAERCIWSDHYERPRLAPFDQNFFTYCFFRMHDWEHARRGRPKTPAPRRSGVAQFTDAMPTPTTFVPTAAPAFPDDADVDIAPPPSGTAISTTIRLGSMPAKGSIVRRVTRAPSHPRLR